MINLVGNNNFFTKYENKRWIIVSIIISFFILLPILSVFFKNFFQDGENTFDYIWNTLVLEYSLSTIYLIFLTSFFSLILGIFPAWYISLYKFPLRNFYDIVLFLPLAIPSYIMSFTYSDILSFTGPIQSFLRNELPYIYPFFNKDYLQIEILSILLGFALSPYIYSVSRISFSLIGTAYYNLSRNLGLSSFKIFYKIILPLSRPAILSGLFLVIMEVLNEYGAVKYFGVNTFTTGIFKAWFSFGDVKTSIQLASILLAIVFILLIVEKNSTKKTKFHYKINAKSNTLIDLDKRKLFTAHTICMFPILFGFFVPFLHILNNSIMAIKTINISHLFELTLNSILISFLSAFLIVLLATFFQYCERLSRGKVAGLINSLISLGYAIPGAVVGLGIIILFTSINYYFDSVYLIGTLFTLIYALVIRFLAVGKSPIKSSLEKHPKSYDETGKILGLYSLGLFRKVFFPINISAMIIAFIITFVDLMKELPITLILRPFNFDTLATQTYEFAIEEMLVKSSIYSLVIILIGASMLIILKKIINKNNYVS